MTIPRTNHTTMALVPGIESLLTVRDVAGILGVCTRTVQRIIAEKHLRAVKVGNSVRIEPADLRRYIDVAKGETTP